MKKIVLLHFFILNFLSFQICLSASNWVFLEFNDIVRAQPVPYAGTAFPTLSVWSTACKSQPKNRDGADFKKGHSGFNILIDQNLKWQEFKNVLDAWFKMMTTGPLSDSSLWQNSNHAMKKPSHLFYDVTKRPEFTPFAQKIIAQADDQFFIRGDLHGDIFSLLAQLEKMRDENILDDSFRIIPDNAWVLFLGDYVDRGQYGCEVLYTMLRLSLANPDRVIFVRGNHEDIGISSIFGFKEEVFYKFNDDKNGTKHTMISRMNDLLPVVLYIGCKDSYNPIILDSELSVFVTNYLQCCHGGLEIGYDPKSFLDNHATMYQLLGLLNQKSFINNFVVYCDYNISGVKNWLYSWVKTNQYAEKKKRWQESWINVEARLVDNYLLEYPTDGPTLGFMWNDFNITNQIPVQYDRGRGLRFGKELTQQILELQSSNSSKICGVFRAHQHGDDDMMINLKRNNGVYKLWQGIKDLKVAQNCADVGNYRTILGGTVWTFNVGADSVYGKNFAFNFDAYARLVVQPVLKDWKMQVFNTMVV